jgi:hypothetical protein
MISVKVAARGCGYSGLPNLLFADDKACTIVHSKRKWNMTLIKTDSINTYVDYMYVCVNMVITFPVYMPHPTVKKSIPPLTTTHFRDHIFSLPQRVLHEWQ